MRQFIVSAGRMFQSRAAYALRRPGFEPQRGVTQTSTKDHPVQEPHMSGMEQTKEKITNKGKAGFGSDIKPVEMPIVERARVKGADRQATQFARGEEAIGNANLKTSLQDDMNAGIGINQSDATTGGKRWTETAKEQTRDLKSENKNKSTKEQEHAAKQKSADERVAKYPNMPKQESKQNIAPPKEHRETDKITSVINEEHGIPDVGERKTHKSAAGITDSHEQHGAPLKGDDMVFEHQPKMRFDPARSYAENAADFQPSRRNIVNTADHQRMQQPQKGMADSMRITGAPAEDWSKEMSEQRGQKAGAKKTANTESQKTDFNKTGSKTEAQTIDTNKKTAKTEGKKEANEAESRVQPQMRGEFGIPSGSPVGGIVNPEKRQRATGDFNHSKSEVKQ